MWSRIKMREDPYWSWADETQESNHSYLKQKTARWRRRGISWDAFHFTLEAETNWIKRGFKDRQLLPFILYKWKLHPRGSLCSPRAQGHRVAWSRTQSPVFQLCLQHVILILYVKSNTHKKININASRSIICITGTSLVVQRLRLHIPNTGGWGSIPGQGTRPHMPQLRVWMPPLRPNTAKQIFFKKKYS